jgi:hypothetical protein
LVEEEFMTWRRYLGGLLLLAWCGLTEADEGALLSVKDVLKKAHSGPKSILTQLNMQLRAGELDWAAVEKNTHQLVELATALRKNQPPQGDKASWDKLTKQYLENAKKLNDAAAEHDKALALSTRAKLGG